MINPFDEIKKYDIGTLAKLKEGSQYIDTETVTQFADGLNSVNQNINDDFERFKAKAETLEDSWHSSAGARACKKMYEIFSLSKSRSAVIQNYVNLFRQQVNPNYISAENTNTSLADEFK